MVFLEKWQIIKKVHLGFMLILVFLISNFAIIPAVNAQMRVAAVVNDDIISLLDLEQRIRLAAVAGGTQINLATMQKLAPQVLRGLIDETLKVQAAKEAGITVKQNDIDNAIKDIADRNKINVADFNKMLASNGILEASLRNQLEAQLLWTGFMRRKMGREIVISDEEVKDIIEAEKLIANRPRIRIQEIFLTSDTENALSSLENVRKEIVDGADFSALARAFSQSASAEKGGDVGLIIPEQLEGDLAAALNNLKLGELSQIISTATGYYLLRINEIIMPAAIEAQSTAFTPIHVELMQFALQLSEADKAAESPNPPPQLQALYESYQKDQANVKGCELLPSWVETLTKDKAVDENSTAKIAKINDIAEDDLPDTIKDKVKSLEIGEISAPTIVGDNWISFALCNRINPDKVKQSDADEKIMTEARNRLGNEKLAVLEKRVLRDLRRAAFIDVRM